MLSMHLFIISWEGQHEKAISIAKSIFSATNQISIVYSDPNSDLTLDVDCQCIRRPNELFWGDKFKACLDVCNSDLMVVIHADCDCEDWSFLVHKCRSAMDQNPIIAVWAPLIDWTQWNIHRTRLYEIRYHFVYRCGSNGCDRLLSVESCDEPIEAREIRRQCIWMGDRYNGCCLCVCEWHARSGR